MPIRLLFPYLHYNVRRPTRSGTILFDSTCRFSNLACRFHILFAHNNLGLLVFAALHIGERGRLCLQLLRDTYSTSNTSTATLVTRYLITRAVADELAGLAGGVGVWVRLVMIIRRTIMETITTYLCVRFLNESFFSLSFKFQL